MYQVQFSLSIIQQKLPTRPYVQAERQETIEGVGTVEIWAISSDNLFVLLAQAWAQTYTNIPPKLYKSGKEKYINILILDLLLDFKTSCD